MSSSLRTAAPIRAIDDASVLRACLEERLAEHYGRTLAIRKIRRRTCPYSSSFRIEEIDAWLDDGSAVRLVLKDLSRDAMLEEARRARPEFLSDARREIGAYAAILPKAPAGTATWYGRFAHERQERHWLLLSNTYGHDRDWLMRPWLIDTYRDLFRNVGFVLEREEVFTGLKDAVEMRALMSVFRA